MRCFTDNYSNHWVREFPLPAFNRPTPGYEHEYLPLGVIDSELQNSFKALALRPFLIAPVH